MRNPAKEPRDEWMNGWDTWGGWRETVVESRAPLQVLLGWNGWELRFPKYPISDTEHSGTESRRKDQEEEERKKREEGLESSIHLYMDKTSFKSSRMTPRCSFPLLLLLLFCLFFPSFFGAVPACQAPTEPSDDMGEIRDYGRDRLGRDVSCECSFIRPACLLRTTLPSILSSHPFLSSFARCFSLCCVGLVGLPPQRIRS